MKAMVYHGNRDVRLRDVEEPHPGPGEAKLRIDYCGICATDIEEYIYGPAFISHDEPNPLTGRKIPITIGHELTGTVVETGEDVRNVRPGDRAVINGVLTCGSCWWCLRGETGQCPLMTAVGFGADGGLAEYIVWPASHVITLPASVSSREAGLVEPAAVGHHAVMRGRVGPGEAVAVVGVGPVGLLAMQAARTMGARVFAVDRRPMSLDLAVDLGADGVVNVDEEDPGEALRRLTGGMGPDVVIDAAGGPETTQQSVEWVRNGGRVVLVAIHTSKPEFDFVRVVAKEVEVVGTLAYLQSDVEDVVRHISSGSIVTEPLISDVIGLEEVIDVGYARMTAGAKDFFRILVSPTK